MKSRWKLLPNKSPGYDLITRLNELPYVAIKFITQLMNAILRLGHFPDQWKVAQIILIPKPGKPHTEVSSYRPISLLPILSKVFEKLLLKRLLITVENDVTYSHLRAPIWIQT